MMKREVGRANATAKYNSFRGRRPTHDSPPTVVYPSIYRDTVLVWYPTSDKFEVQWSSLPEELRSPLRFSDMLSKFL
uniref:Uncharacterized protein n=1 Tax=Vespula pensylvanica TaxID=30213 RepID=A0A834PDA5_VESPE|nr:hypothetical protein H0235_004183 [Vespula pensylvanica]